MPAALRISKGYHCTDTPTRRRRDRAAPPTIAHRQAPEAPESAVKSARLPHTLAARALAMLIGIFGVLIARTLGVYGCLSFLSTTKWVRPFNFAEQTIINISGVRGALSIALAFSVPEKLDYWWTIQSIAFGVVLFTLVIQAPAISWLLTRTNWLKKLRT